MRIVSVNTANHGGGAAVIANTIHQSLIARGHQSQMVVADKVVEDPHTHLIRQTTQWEETFNSITQKLIAQASTVKGSWRFSRVTQNLARFNVNRLRALYAGREPMDYPASRRFLAKLGLNPQLLHLHNLHGGYFDLRQLQPLSHRLPVMITLHDMWMLTGHCAYSFDCNRYEIGCGNCPYPKTYPAIRRDATDKNIALKRDIYANSKLYIATPSQWLMDAVDKSVLQEGIVEQRVIYNGVDTDIFKPADDKSAVRDELDLPQNSLIILFAAAALSVNMFKDYKTLRASLEALDTSKINQKVTFVALGREGTDKLNNDIEIIFVPFQTDPNRVAAYYQASDIFVHSTLADTFPTTILEASACGLPVIASDIGGVPEQIKHIEDYDTDEATGVLVPAQNVEAMLSAFYLLLGDSTLRQQLGTNAHYNVQRNFTKKQFIDNYIAWYHDILKKRAISVDDSHKSF